MSKLLARPIVPTARRAAAVVAGGCVTLALGAAPASADVATPLPGPSFESVGKEMVAYKGHLYFAADDGIRGNELWRTDGTAAGTTIVADLDTFNDDSNPSRLTVVDGRLFFNVGGPGSGSLDLVYVYTGSGTPTQISVPPTESTGGIVGTVNNRLLFRGYTGNTVHDYHALYAVQPGATSGSIVSPGVAFDHNAANLPATTGGWAYFEGMNTVGTGLGPELYRTNGTTTELVKDIAPGSSASQPSRFTAAGSQVFFTAHTTAGRELWRTDGTSAGTVMVKEHVPGSGGPAFYDVVGHGGQLYYAVNDPTTGNELWTSDGTTAGTRVVRDIVPGTQGSGPTQLTSAGSRLYFRTNFGPWVTDGTAAGTVHLAQPANDGHGPLLLTAFHSRLYFRAGAKPGGSVVWRSDGTPATTFALSAGAFDADPAAGNASVGTIGVLGSKVIFTSRFPGDPGRTTWSRLNVIDTTAPDVVRQAIVGPSLTGTPMTGQRLTVAPGTWNLSPQTYTYQWYRDGQPIPGATAPTLYLADAYAGATILAGVTASGLRAPAATAFTAPVGVATPGGGGGGGGGGGTADPGGIPGGDESPKPAAKKVTLGTLKAKASRTRRITLTMRPSKAGRATVTARIKVGRRTHTVASGKKTAKRSGTLKVTLKPNKKGKRYLKRGRTYRVTLRVSFKPSTGSTAIRTRSLRIKIPRR